MPLVYFAAIFVAALGALIVVGFYALLQARWLAEAVKDFLRVCSGH